MEVTGDSDVLGVGAEVRTERSARDFGQALLEDVGRIIICGEGNCVEAEFVFGVVESDFVDEIRTKKGAVNRRACFDKDAEEVVVGEKVEYCDRIDAV